jgi:phage FluMu gp28-like protein
MKAFAFTSAGLSGTVSIPETVEEFNALAKREGACLDEAVSNVLYRSVFNDFREDVVDAIVAAYGIPQKTVDHPTKKKEDGSPEQVVDPKDSGARYINRAAAELGVAVTEFQNIANEVCKKLTFDPSQRERKAKSSEPTRTDLDTADGLIAQGPEKLAISIGKLQAVTGGVVDMSGDDAAVIRRNIAFAVRDYRRAIEAQAKAGLTA